MRTYLYLFLQKQNPDPGWLWTLVSPRHLRRASPDHHWPGISSSAVRVGCRSAVVVTGEGYCDLASTRPVRGSDRSFLVSKQIKIHNHRQKGVR